MSAGSGPDSLVLKVSQDAYQGSAQYAVKVDGVQVGGTFTASALRASGQSDTLTLKGDWTAGAHTVSVEFLNDRWDGTAETDRNLYVDGATYNGQAVAGAALAFSGTGTKGISFVDAAAAPAQPPPSPAPAPPAPAAGANFFAPSSPWNTKVPAGKAFTEVPGLDALADKGAVGLNSWSDGYASTAIWRAKSSDPLVPIRHMDDTWSPVDTGSVKRSGNDAAAEKRLLAQADDINQFPQNPYSTQKAAHGWNSGGGVPLEQYDEWKQTAPLYARIPADAVPAPDGDGLTVVVQPDGRALQMYSPIKLSDCTWISQMFTLSDSVNGMGDGEENGQRASMLPLHAGAITEEDVASGAIDHALVANVPASMLKAAFTYPALAIDSDPNYTGTVPMGSRLAIPPSVDTGKLGLDTELGRMIARAVQDYGMYVGDRGGEGVSLGAQYEPSGGPLRYSDAVAADLQDIFRAVQLVQPDHVVIA